MRLNAFDVPTLHECLDAIERIHGDDDVRVAILTGEGRGFSAGVGVGSAFAMNCDLTVMAEDAYLYQAFGAIGLIPDGGATCHLARTIGEMRALQTAMESGLEAVYSCEAEIQGLWIASEDAKEGVAAFMQKRKPAFRGR